MKKHIAAILLFVLLLTVNSPAIFADQRYGHYYFEYYVRDGGIEICGYLGSEEVVNVPKFIAGLPVYAIVEGAFADCPTVKQIILPETIMVIEEGAISSSISVAFLGKAYGEQGKDDGASGTPETFGEDVEKPSNNENLPADNTSVGENEIRTDGAEEPNNDLAQSVKENADSESEDLDGSQRKEDTNKENISVQEKEEQKAEESSLNGRIVFLIILITLLAVAWIIIFKMRKR